jgi:hypothetical protein
MVALPAPPPAPKSLPPEPAPRRPVTKPAIRFAFTAWLGKLFPSGPRHLPDDATVPGKAERRMALRLAAVIGAAALFGLAPVFGLGRANLSAPPWAVAIMLLAVLQLSYAAWMVNAPDWVTARVQMVVSAVVGTVYAMVMTLTLFAPAHKSMIFGLGEVRRFAPGWCGLMFLLLGAVTWHCGRTSTRWRRQRLEDAGEASGMPTRQDAAST